MARKVTIELTETQARVVLAAVEDWFRLRMGQEYHLADDLAFYGYERESDNFDRCIQKRDAIHEVIRAMFRIAWPAYGAPREVTPETHIASDIWSQLRWELSTKEEWMSTPFQMGSEPMPKITVEVIE